MAGKLTELQVKNAKPRAVKYTKAAGHGLTLIVMPDGSKPPLWTTLGDAVNNATVKTTGPSPFNSPVALIFTPDQGTDGRIRTALRRTGYPPAVVNTMVLPSSMLQLGENETADELTPKMRIGMAEEARRLWTHTSRTPEQP